MSGDDFDDGDFPPTEHPDREFFTALLFILAVIWLTGWLVWKLFWWVW
jgi:hypothetical protein